MSRGHGAVERAILTNIQHEDNLLPLVFIALVAGYDHTKESVRQSFRRAAHQLQKQGLVDIRTITAPTADGLSGPTNYRRILCVCRPGLTDRDARAAQLMAAICYNTLGLSIK
jgi:hypothetical protein